MKPFVKKMNKPFNCLDNINAIKQSTRLSNQYQRVDALGTPASSCHLQPNYKTLF